MIFYLTVCKPLSILTGHILLHILFALHYLTALPILANGPLLKIYLAINLLTPRNFFIKMFSPLSYSQSEIALTPTPSGLDVFTCILEQRTVTIYRTETKDGYICNIRVYLPVGIFYCSQKQ